MLGPQAAHPDKPRPPVTALAKARHDIAVIPTAAGDQLVGSCPPPPAAASQLPVVPFMAQGQMWVAVLHVASPTWCSSICVRARWQA